MTYSSLNFIFFKALYFAGKGFFGGPLFFNKSLIVSLKVSYLPFFMFPTGI